MKNFFQMSSSQTVAGIIGGTIFGVFASPSIIEWMGKELIKNLTSDKGLVMGLLLVGSFVYIALVAYTAFLKRGAGQTFRPSQEGQR